MAREPPDDEDGESTPMKSTGMARKIDELGRLVLPAEIRRRFGLREGSYLEIQVDDNKIVLSKIDDSCVFCGTKGQLRQFRDQHVCVACHDQLADQLVRANGG
jgi:transcriptional pleiotropic regulator of transition state genes